MVFVSLLRTLGLISPQLPGPPRHVSAGGTTAGHPRRHMPAHTHTQNTQSNTTDTHTHIHTHQRTRQSERHTRTTHTHTHKQKELTISHHATQYHTTHGTREHVHTHTRVHTHTNTSHTSQRPVAATSWLPSAQGAAATVLAATRQRHAHATCTHKRSC